MNIFGSSGPSPGDFQRESIIKSQITENLKEAIKVLQKTHINSDEPIYSEEAANAVCNVLEAVFLHGLKASVTKKSFWGLLQNITHKDVLLQLTQLKQITTEIGLCRAWLRLALNDGVLESYLNAIINDKKTLRYYYKRTAYLRDTEHPGILLTFTQSLSHFHFELAYNSSLLNIWTHTPMMLSGLVTPQSDPRPVIARGHHAVLHSEASPVVKHDSPNRSGSRSKHSQHMKVKPRTCNVARIDHIHDTDEEALGPATPPNTPYDPSQLTEVDIEAIRNLTRTAGSGSSSTGTSQISQPDPIDARQLVPELVTLRVHLDPSESEPEASRKLPNQSHMTSRSNSLSVTRPTTFTADQPKIKCNRSSEQPSSTNCFKTSSVENISRQSKDNSLITIINTTGTSSVMQHSYDDALNPFNEEDYDNTFNPFATDVNQVTKSDEESSNVKSAIVNNSVGKEAEKDVHIESYNPFDSTVDTQQDTECSDQKNPFNLTPKETVSDDRSGDTKDESNVPEEQFLVQMMPDAGTPFVNRDASVRVNHNTPDELILGESKISSLFPVLPEKTGVSTACELAGSINECTTEENIHEEHSVTGAEAENEVTGMESSDQSKLAAIKPIKSTNSLTASLSQSSSFPKFDVGKSPPLEPVLSTAMATSESVEIAKEAIAGLSSSLTGSLSLSPDNDDSYQQKGNSLRFMEGWSSDFDTSLRSNTDEVFIASDVHIPSVNNVCESFDTMLQNYGSTVNRVEVRTISEVIDGLPALEVEPFNVEQLSTRTLQKVPSPGDEVIAEYEVLPDIMEKRAYLSEPMYQPLLDLLGIVTTEKGLDVQNYQCNGCSRPIGMFYGKARVCGYDSCYYCFECHENDDAYIPARIIYNWDFRKQKVCHQNLKFLQQCEDDPLLNIQMLNPKLYVHVPEMSEVQDLRTQLRYLKSYLFTCKQSVADALKKQIWPREYYYEDIHLYSLYDLLQVATGQLARTLSAIVKFASKHVYECGLCSQKGFICEICSNPKVIYPFEVNITVKCERCHSVYHKDCKQSVNTCPKCERRMKFQQLQGAVSQAADGLSDYSFSLETSSSNRM